MRRKKEVEHPNAEYIKSLEFITEQQRYLQDAQRSRELDEEIRGEKQN